MGTRLVMLAVLAVIFALGGYYLWREWRIDRCFDGGGRWNYETRTCDPAPKLD